MEGMEEEEGEEKESERGRGKESPGRGGCYKRWSRGSEMKLNRPCLAKEGSPRRAGSENPILVRQTTSLEKKKEPLGLKKNHLPS